MSKLILLIFLGFLAFILYKGLRRAAVRREREVRAARSEPEHMVACARCGLHLPESEALEGIGGRFCSEEHRRLGAS
jgi:uncharacterized protein